jgi:hypothetical protein
MLDDFRAQAAQQGQTITFKLNEQFLLILNSDGASPPQPRYIATTVAYDERLDLAVLQIVGDGSGPINPELLHLPFVPLGNSDITGLGDPIDIFGYPGNEGGALTYTPGVVSGFLAEEGVSTRAWIITDATLSGGSSGGTAINRQGELIGVPTWGSPLDCRPSDLNQDGRIDASELTCIGGSLGNIRPINLAASLLTRAGYDELPRTNGSGSGPTFTPVPTGPADGMPPIVVWLPTVLPLPHASCFRIEDDGDLTFAQLLGRFDNSADAAGRLQSWGWQASAFRTFACDGPPRGEAGWIEIDLHLFADAASAQEAVDYFATVRAAGTTLLPGSPPAIGDHAAVLSGPATNGNEFTLYASQGPLLIRVTGVSPSGIPFSDVLKVAQSILATQPGTLPSGPAPNPPPTVTTAPAYAYLPSSPAVSYATCFSVIDDGTYSYSDIRSALGKTGMSESDIAALGWQDGAYRVFSCPAPPPGRASQLDVVIHRFRDVAAAQQVLPFMRGSYVPAASEVRHCGAAASLVVCVLGRSRSGSPLSDVDFVLQQILAQ